MAISIDTVYQKVLMLANKEQRGYITPQEFNMFADMAQMEIFEQYFYDLSQLSRIHGNSDDQGDIKRNLEEKISIFERVIERNNQSAIGSSSQYNLYRIGSIDYNGVVVEEIQQKELTYISTSPKLKPSLNQSIENMVYYTRANILYVLPSHHDGPFNVTYIRKPDKPSWTYVVVNQKAMYDANNPSQQDFQLHDSEENELVYRILGLAGVSIKRPDLTQIGASLVQAQIQQEKQ